MKNIFIVISYTGTSISKAIKICTKNSYTHISISLDEELNELYSFGRLYSYIVVPAGFVHEGIDVGTFKRFKKTKVAIFSKEVTEEQYRKIKHVIKQIEKDKNKYKFNFLGMLAVQVGRKFARANHFYCAEFVKYILNEGGVTTEELPELAKPQDFIKLSGLTLMYEGVLSEYSHEATIKCS